MNNSSSTARKRVKANQGRLCPVFSPGPPWAYTLSWLTGSLTKDQVQALFSPTRQILFNPFKIEFWPSDLPIKRLGGDFVFIIEKRKQGLQIHNRPLGGAFAVHLWGLCRHPYFYGLYDPTTGTWCKLASPRLRRICALPLHSQPVRWAGFWVQPWLFFSKSSSNINEETKGP